MVSKNRKTTPNTIKVAGLILSEGYQRCKLFAQRLHKYHKSKFHQPSINGFLDMDWVDYLQKLRKDIGGKTWGAKFVVVFVNGTYLGGEQELFHHYHEYTYTNPSSGKIMEAARQEYTEYLNRGNLLYVFLELSMEDEYMGTLLFQLRHDILPLTSMWFTEFCTHRWYTYRGTKINRVCKRGWFQSEEVTMHWDNRAGYTGMLDDEGFSYKHDRRGILSFTNTGPHSNECQFFVNFEPAEWMDGRYVAFGRVVEGSDLLRRIENTPCTYEKPDRDIIITKCGLAKVGLGRALDPSLRAKGIIVGEPHIHLEFFADLLMERFEQMLFERLSEELKKLVEGEWTIDILWNHLMTVMNTKRPPVDDVLDPREASSKEYVVERFHSGLYGLKEVADLFIRDLLVELIGRAVEMSGIQRIAKSIVDFLVNTACAEIAMGSPSLEKTQSLVEDLSSIIFGPESKRDELVEKISSHPAFNDLQKTVKGADIKSESSKTQSLAAFIWDILTEMLENVKSKLN